MENKLFLIIALLFALGCASSPDSTLDSYKLDCVNLNFTASLKFESLQQDEWISADEQVAKLVSVLEKLEEKDKEQREIFPKVVILCKYSNGSLDSIGYDGSFVSINGEVYFKNADTEKAFSEIIPSNCLEKPDFSR